MSSAFLTFYRVGVAEPLIPSSVELTTVDPKISVRARIGAQFPQFASAFTACTRRAFLVRSSQSLHVISAVGFKDF